MPVPKKKRITAENALSTSEASSSPLPEQQEFHQHLRALAQSAVRAVLELVMREELDAFIGAAWGECSRQQQRLSQWLLHARSGDSDGPTRRSEACPEIGKANSTARSLNVTAAMNVHRAISLTQMFVAGTSTHKVGEVAQTLLGVTPSASTISRLNQSLSHQFDTWRECRLQEH
jgi:putative transposase